MFDLLFLGTFLESLNKIPKEIVYGTAAYFTLTELHKQYAKMKTAKFEAYAQVQALELEVEKLRLQLELHNARANTPLD